MKSVTILVVLLMVGMMGLAGCAGVSATRSAVEPTEFETMDAQMFTLRDGGGVATVRMHLLPEDGDAQLTVERQGVGHRLACDNVYATTHAWAAVVPLYGDGEALFYVSTDGGTGYDRWQLWVLNPRECEVVGLAVVNLFDAGQAESRVEVTSNFHDARFAAEREFLEQMKYRYEYRDAHMLAAQTEDMDLAAYFWRQDNGKLTDGVMKIRRYKGQVRDFASRKGAVTIGKVHYTAFFKSGVWGYDPTRDESFVVYHPANGYHWPDGLYANGQYLLVPPGEDWHLIDTRTWRIVRLECESRSYQVTGFEVREGEVVLSDGTHLKLPAK